ncbi:MAG: succinate dehydrogenase, hydrophobic membrane anchor protein [Holosporales bacterium]
MMRSLLRLRTPLSVARGDGSIKSGAEHWLAQRFSAVLLVFLGLWFVATVLSHLGLDAAGWRQVFATPFNALLSLAFLLSALFHGYLGMQVIIEDYIHHRGMRLACLWFIRALSLLAALGATLALIYLLMTHATPIA